MDIPLLAVIVDARFRILQPFLRAANRRKNLVAHLDQVQSLDGGLLVPGDHRRDRVADVAHALARQRIFVDRHRHDAERHREILEIGRAHV